MKKLFIATSTLLSIGLSSCNHIDFSKTKNEKEEKMTITNKQKVISLLKSFESGDKEPISYINPNKYVQHNLTVADGLDGFKALLNQFTPNSVTVNTVRVFQDADIVFAHTDYNFGSPMVGFDVFRFEDGKIVEHWDNLQPKPSNNPSGHSMTDGETEIIDIEKTDENKELAKNFVEDILVNGKIEKLTNYISTKNYIQHNPSIPDQIEGLKTAFETLAKDGIKIKYDKIHHVFAEGNFVLVISEGFFGNAHNSFYDLFRIENGKIQEHWDTIELIPSEDTWKNKNGKF